MFIINSMIANTMSRSAWENLRAGLLSEGACVKPAGLDKMVNSYDLVLTFLSNGDHRANTRSSTEGRVHIP